MKSRLTYCSQVWRPHNLKDINPFRANTMQGNQLHSKCFSFWLHVHKSRLNSLHLFPLTYTYELLDILFLVRNLQCPDPSFPISEFVSFSSSSTRAGHSLKLIHQSSHTHLSNHSYFKTIVWLWNALPPIDLKLSLPTIKTHLKNSCGPTSLTTLIQI